MQLTEPRPRHPVERATCEPWPVDRQYPLEKGLADHCVDFFELLERRRTRRQLAPVDWRDISRLLWTSNRLTATSDDFPDWKRTPVPTPGGLAAVRIVIVRESEGSWLYDPDGHSVGRCPVRIEATDRVLAEARGVIDSVAGDLLMYVADRPLVEHYYEAAESLVLRESGTISALHALACEALNLGYCPLGTLGSSWAGKILGVSEEVIVPGGAALLGGR